jgi:hypothetical protein
MLTSLVARQFAKGSVGLCNTEQEKPQHLEIIVCLESDCVRFNQVGTREKARATGVGMILVAQFNRFLLLNLD